MKSVNEFGQPIGEAVTDWMPAVFPSKTENLIGKKVILELLNVQKHANDLFEALRYDSNGESWTYLPYGPFNKDEDFPAFEQKLQQMVNTSDMVPYVVTLTASEDKKPLGICAYARINSEHGTIEVGSLHFSKLLKQSTATTEAMFVMMR